MPVRVRWRAGASPPRSCASGEPSSNDATRAAVAERVAAFPADDWRRRAAEFNEPRLSRNLRLVELLREIGNGHGVSPGVVAVAWTLQHPAITAAIVGGRSAKQVQGLAPALHFRLSEEEYNRINTFTAPNPA